MKTIPTLETTHPHDDGLEWLRAIRREITTSFDHDQTRLGDYLREREKQLDDRIARTQRRVVQSPLLLAENENRRVQSP